MATARRAAWSTSRSRTFPASCGNSTTSERLSRAPIRRATRPTSPIRSATCCASTAAAPDRPYPIGLAAMSGFAHNAALRCLERRAKQDEDVAMPARAGGRTSIAGELGATLHLAGPLIAGQLFAIGANVVDAMLAGHLGAHVLGAVAIGTSIW